jgi:hypothetical protein
MAERFKAAVLKTVERKLRGFESLSLRHYGHCVRHDEVAKRIDTTHGEVAERLKAAAC